MDLPPSKAMGTLENYSSGQVTTRNGHLEITLQRDPAHPAGAKSQKRDGSSGGDWKYASGMLQSWNKMCFQGGILEGTIPLQSTIFLSSISKTLHLLTMVSFFSNTNTLFFQWR